MASRRRSGVVLRDGASTGSAPPQDKRTNLPLSTKTRTTSTGGSAPASHRPAFAAKESPMNATNRKEELREPRADSPIGGSFKRERGGQKGVIEEVDGKRK